MHSIDVKHDIYKGFGYININFLKNHEEVVAERATSLLTYLESIENYLVLPSILICNETHTIIDGHHRCWALKQLGIKEAPVTFLNYSHPSIIPHLDDSLTKKEVIDAATTGILLKPKSSYHHVIDIYGDAKPLILLSSLSRCDR